MEEQTYDKEFYLKIYIEKLDQARKIAKDQETKGVTLSMDNVVSIATTMFITASQNISRGKRY